MSERASVSVALATYNGEKYVLQQVDSILTQLLANDQLVISDNGSTDQTLSLIQEHYGSDPRVELISCRAKGVIANFSFALSYCKNEIIFLSDQDDIWQPNKVDVFLDNFAKHPEISVMMSDIEVVDNNLKTVIPSFFEYRGTRLGVIKNIVKNTYIGCAMAMRRSFIQPLLPIPSDVPMHDMWIGIMANKKKQAMLIPDKLVFYRRHGETVTTVENNSTLLEKINWRYRIIKNTFFIK